MKKIIEIFLSEKPKHQIITAIFVSLIFSPFIVGGIVWFESRPQTNKTELKEKINYQELQYEEIRNIREIISKAGNHDP